MLKNYFKVALRNIQRNKLYAGLNILGLSLGIASFLIIYFFVQNELSFDRFHKKSDQVYRIIQSSQNKSVWYGGLTAAIAPAAHESLPQIEAFTRIESWNKTFKIPSLNDTTLGFRNISVDQGFYEIFDLELLSGQFPNYLENPNTALISEKMADRFFSGNAIGTVIDIRNKSYTIIGQYESFPSNSSIQGDFILPFETANEWRKDSFTEFNSSYFDQSYLLITDKSDVDLVTDKVNKIYIDNLAEGIMPTPMELEPLKELHFGLHVDDVIGSKTDKQYIYIFSVVAMVILLSSFFNFINLSVAQSIERTKEIGVRKVLGAKRTSVYAQFFAESLFLVSLSFVIGLVIVEAISPQLEQLLERKLALTVILSTSSWLGIGLLIALLTSLSTIYPALISNRRGISNMVNAKTGSKTSIGWIKLLSVFQLVLFMTLISVGLLSQRQLKFMQNENLGFDKENIMIVSAYPAKFNQYGQAFYDALANIPGINGITKANSMPTAVLGSSRFRGFDFDVFNFPVATNYFDVMNMQIIAGRSFLPSEINDQNVVMLNETAIRGFGLEIEGFEETTLSMEKIQFKVIGVVKDFHFLSKKEPIKAIKFRAIPEEQGSMLIKLDANRTKQTLLDIKDEYKKLTGFELPFEFMEDSIDKQYKLEHIIVTIIKASTVMAAIVAFIGLFGMTGYSTKQRIKEIGIRKVLGANFMSIQKVLNTQTLMKICISAVISIPLIYYWSNLWLDSFAYRIEFPFLLIGGVLITGIAISLSTILFHSIKAYLINPVEILKDE